MDAGIAPPIVVERSCTTLAPPKWQGSYRSASFSSPHENRFAGFSRGPRWSCQRKPSRGPSRRCAAHLGRPCTVQKKNAFRPNLPVLASLGMRRLIASFPQIYPVSSRCAVTRLSTHAYAASCHVSSNSRVLVETPYLWPRCRSMGMDSKGRGRSPFLLVVQERGPGGNPAERVSPWPLFGGDPFLSAREMGRICPTPIGVDNLSFDAQL